MMSKYRISTLIAVVLALAVTPLVAETIEDTIEKTLPFGAGDRLELSNTNGDVEITAWDRQEIQIEARKKVKSSSSSKAQEAFEELEILIEATGNGVRVDTEYPRGMDSWWRNVSSSVRYSIRIPEQADMDVETVNGKIFIEGVHGRIDLGSTNGGIRVEEAGGSVTARTTNGSIDVELGQVEPTADMSFRTTNGGITLTLPSDLQASLTARTTNGSVQTDFPITVQGTFRKNRLEGEINGGGAAIELKTTNGSIRIREL